MKHLDSSYFRQTTANDEMMLVMNWELHLILPLPEQLYAMESLIHQSIYILSSDWPFSLPCFDQLQHPLKDNQNGNFKCSCLRKPGDMAKSRNMKVVQIYSFLVW